MKTMKLDIATRDGGTVALDRGQLTRLGSAIAGRILRAGDDGWDDAVRVWNAMAKHRPAVVVQPATPSDVALVVSFARDCLGVVKRQLDRVDRIVGELLDALRRRHGRASRASRDRPSTLEPAG